MYPSKADDSTICCYLTEQSLQRLGVLLCHEHFHETFQHWKIVPSRLAYEKKQKTKLDNMQGNDLVSATKFE